MYTLSATFTFIDSEKKQEFLDILNSPDGLAITRVWPGCVSIECYNVQGNENQVFLWERWEKQSNYQSYIAMRKQTGMFAILDSLLEKPFEVVCFERVQSFVEDEQITREFL